MMNDIRVFEADNGRVQVTRVIYEDNGDIHQIVQPPISEHEDMESALTFLDQLYQATLKPVLMKLSDGSYE